MTRRQLLEVPQQVAGTDLRPVVALIPVAAHDETGGATTRDAAEGGREGSLVKGALAAALVGHVALAGAALKDALARPDIVWDTAGIAKQATVAKIALLPMMGSAAYTKDVKPKLEVAASALALQGG